METNLVGKYAIVGIGETEYSRGSGRSTRAMGAMAGPQGYGRCGIGFYAGRRNA
ncbi:MAG: hypothetical protein Ct9H300mP11_03090 [Chloroflexota bacterium]|nr:MAG: hypothetical protein Ct9H300mP11_03090 [Chloroflexota bacterium]